jgi:hypothetical protein
MDESIYTQKLSARLPEQSSERTIVQSNYLEQLIINQKQAEINEELCRRIAQLEQQIDVMAKIIEAHTTVLDQEANQLDLIVSQFKD